MAKRRGSRVDEPIPLRPGARWLGRASRGGSVGTVYGSGILIYDAGNRPALEQTALGACGAGIFEADEEALGATDLFWAFTVTLYENDGPFHAQWWVGPPPDPSEAARPGRANNGPQARRLSLPTGRVRVEGSEAISFGPHGSTAEGVGLRVPRGVYDVSLHQAPDPGRDVSRRYFFLSFAPLPGVSPPSAPRRVEPDPRDLRADEEAQRMALYEEGRADASAGKPRQSSNLYYRRGWSRGKQERDLYERGLAAGLANQPARSAWSELYMQGWHEGNRRRTEGEA